MKSNRKFTKLREKIISFRLLENGWDSYGAEKPTDSAITDYSHGLSRGVLYYFFGNLVV